MRNFLNEISFYLFQLKLNFRNQKALRSSFWLVIFGTLLGQFSYYIIWMFFSRAIGPVNGWGMIQTFGMISMNMLAFGACHSAFGSTRSLQAKIRTGALDGFLNKPKNLYVRVINSEAMPSALGWLLQGVVGLTIFFALTHADLKDVILLLLMFPPAVAIQVSYLMVTDCISFWLPQASDLNRSLNELLFTSANQPVSLLRGPLRFMYLTLIPALLIAGLPIEIVTYHTYELIIIAYTVSLSWLVLSVWILNKSITRYESGNVIGG